MSELVLSPLTALGGTAPLVETIGGVTISENAGLAIASLAARKSHENSLDGVLSPVLGGALPGPGRAVLSADIGAVWTGAGQWFLTAPLATHADLAGEVKTLARDMASVTEQTDGWVVFDLAGGNLIPLLERLCNLNTKAMTAGDATRCRIEHLGCLILCRESARNFTILGPRSSAGSLHHALITAAHSVA